MRQSRITIVGLGYTGLPLLIEFYKKKYLASGFDKDFEKIKRLKLGIDYTKEVNKKDLSILKKTTSIQVGIKKFIDWYMNYYK